MKRVFQISGFAGVCFSLPGFAVSAPEKDLFAELFQPVFKAHCVQCHGQDGKVKGKTDLLALNSSSDLRGNPELLRDLIEVLEFEEMPPEDEPPLEEETRTRLLTALESTLHQALSEKRVYPQTPIRRMNRFQYHNAVTDLFDLKVNVFTLPERMMREHRDYFQPASGKMDDVVFVGNRPLGKSQMIEPRLLGVAAFPQDLRAEHGFDNQADHLSLSPLLMESFLRLSQSITRSPNFEPKTVGIWESFFLEPKTEGDQEAEVRSRLKPFLAKAFRRPVEEHFLDRYTAFVLARTGDGVPFTEAMKDVASAVIASPRFLYLFDESAEGKSVASLDDFEFASRLSFFLWGSLPDEELLSLAAEGELQKPNVLDAQVTRMLKDRKLKRFCDSFPMQWLQLDRIVSSIPNREKFPNFYFSKYRDSMHMAMEPLLLFETVLVENRPITQLIDPDFTYRSRTLQDAYGEAWPEEIARSVDEKGKSIRPGAVTVLRFERLPVKDRRYGGVVTNAAVLTMTSGPERTQPITRGAWLATVIFNDPPEPPPADVPPLSEKPSAEEENLTLRERLTQHRERADCRGCHEQIDPLGFALENFDPVGAWRDRYENGRQVDMSGKLFRKRAFSDIGEFKDAILEEKEHFARAFAGHLLSFGLARELSVADEAALDEVAEVVADDDYRLQSVIREIIFSEPFRSKSNPGTEKALAESGGDSR